jgi:hypothetical protein
LQKFGKFIYLSNDNQDLKKGFTPLSYISIYLYIQKYATLQSLFYLETALNISVGNTTHHQELKQLYLHYLVFVTPLLLPAAIAAGKLTV